MKGGFSDGRGAFRKKGGLSGLNFIRFCPPGGKTDEIGAKRDKIGAKTDEIGEFRFHPESPPPIRKAPFHPESPLLR